MSINYTKYGAQKKIYFKLVDANGDGVTTALVAGDVKISKDDAGGNNNVATLPNQYDSTNFPGCYAWTPSAAECQCEVMTINIVDQTSPAAFIENCIIVPTGGHASAYYDG